MQPHCSQKDWLSCDKHLPNVEGLSLTSTVIVVAMGVVLALILCTLLWLRLREKPGRSAPSTTQMRDSAGVELHDRLARISLPASESVQRAGISPLDAGDPMSAYLRGTGGTTASPANVGPGQRPSVAMPALPSDRRASRPAGSVESVQQVRIEPPSSVRSGTGAAASGREERSWRPVGSVWPCCPRGAAAGFTGKLERTRRTGGSRAFVAFRPARSSR